MVNTFPKDIMDCMKGCILSIFWPKKDIVDFFQKSGCTQRKLMPESEYSQIPRAGFCVGVIQAGPGDQRPGHRGGYGNGQKCNRHGRTLQGRTVSSHAGTD